MGLCQRCLSLAVTHKSCVSIGVEPCPPIGVQQGPHWQRGSRPVAALLFSLRSRRGPAVQLDSRSGFEAPTVVAGFDDVTVVGEPVQQGGGHLCVAEDGVLAAMVLTRAMPRSLLLPLRRTGPQNTNDRTRSTWVQFCPRCLANDASPYLRRHWRLATRVSCFDHGCALRDRCPACRSGLAAFDQRTVTAQHFCARCGFDLRLSPKASITVSARRVERLIDRIRCQTEISGKLVAGLLPTPSGIGGAPGKTLSDLSTATRIRCLERLLVRADLCWAEGEERDGALWHRLARSAQDHKEALADITEVSSGTGDGR